MKRWQLDSKPDSIVDEEGMFVGFADTGWAVRIVNLHNEEVEKSETIKRCSCKENKSTKNLQYN
jgi:hypothetical protein